MNTAIQIGASKEAVKEVGAQLERLVAAGTTAHFDGKTFRSLFATFSKSVAISGVTISDCIIYGTGEVEKRPAIRDNKIETSSTDLGA